MAKKRKKLTKAEFARIATESLGLSLPAPQSFHHFTLAHQVDPLVSAHESEPDLGFMVRMLALCSLPRTHPGRGKEYVRRNGPYTLVMSAGGLGKLPYGNLPRLLLAWVSTEAVRMQSHDLVLGRSLSEVHAQARPRERRSRRLGSTHKAPQPDLYHPARGASSHDDLSGIGDGGLFSLNPSASWGQRFRVRRSLAEIIGRTPEKREDIWVSSFLSGAVHQPRSARKHGPQEKDQTPPRGAGYDSALYRTLKRAGSPTRDERLPPL